MSDFARLKAIGYVVDDQGRPCAPSHDGRPCSSLSTQRMGHMDGRLDNLELIAQWIDEMDGVPYSGRLRPNGREQFEHMASGRSAELTISLLLYVALRRLQRQGNLVALRVGLSILVAYEFREIGGEDALAALMPSATMRDETLAALLPPVGQRSEEARALAGSLLLIAPTV